ncbi:hypothetical protein EG329_008674 [Mollisiaceae sp. DMI_Dod_QoI]|nr:hypothetical protein EG329_008674 [Helotiales sp. DMI_Dod_QoI]
MLSDHRKNSASAETKPGGSGISNSNRTLDFDPSIDQPPPSYEKRPTKPNFDPSINQPPSYEMSNNMDDRVDIPTPQSIHSQSLLNQPQRPEDIEVNTTTTGFNLAFTGPISIAFPGIAFTCPSLRCSTKIWVLLVIAMLAFIIWMTLAFKNPSTT